MSAVIKAVVAIAAGATAVSATVYQAVTTPDHISFFNWLGFSGVAALITGAIQWGKHEAFKETTTKELEGKASKEAVDGVWKHLDGMGETLNRIDTKIDNMRGRP